MRKRNGELFRTGVTPAREGLPPGRSHRWPPGILEGRIRLVPNHGSEVWGNLRKSFPGSSAETGKETPGVYRKKGVNLLYGESV